MPQPQNRHPREKEKLSRKDRIVMAIIGLVIFASTLGMFTIGLGLLR